MPHETPLATLSFRERANRWQTMWGLLRHAGLPVVASGFALTLALALLPLVAIVLMGQVLFLLPDAAAQGSTGPAWHDLLTTFAYAIGVLVVQQVLAPFQAGLIETVARRVDQRCIDRFMTAALSDAPLELLDDPEVLDLLADARGAFARQFNSPGDAASALIPLVGRYTQLIGASVLLAFVVSPLAGALILATALAIRTGVRGTLSKFGALWNSLAPMRRREAYLRDLATTPAITKEIRLLGLLPWLRKRLREDTMATLELRWAGSRRLQFAPFIGFSAIGLVGGASVLVLLALDAPSLDLFALGVAVQAVLIPMRFGVYFPECDVQTQYGLGSFDALTRFERLLAGTDEAAAPATPRDVTIRDDAQSQTPDAPPPVRVLPPGTVRFEDVWFRYSDDDPWVLRGLTLDLVPGTSTAIVGLNGAGKTTTVKLLARILSPSRGRITVDGIDIGSQGADVWRRRLALIFQDYVRLELSVTDNITLGAPHVAADPAVLAEALTTALEAAGAADVVAGLPHGRDTVLSGGYAGGRDLSGGQWQRLVLARALMAVIGGADLLVLDEPTAQLDVRAEAEFFERFLAHGAVERVAQGRLVTSVVISHRFSTVRPADRIIVLSDGAVVEQGTHDELIAAQGRYAELFTLQARRFHTVAESRDDLIAATTTGETR